MLYQHSYRLPPHLSAELFWSHFVNVHGRWGKNTLARRPPHAWNMHLDWRTKDAVKNLGANKTEKAVSQVGRALETVGPVLLTLRMSSHKFQEHTRELVWKRTGHHCWGTSSKKQKKTFNTEPGRKHQTFPRPQHMFFMQRLEMNYCNWWPLD